MRRIGPKLSQAEEERRRRSRALTAEGRHLATALEGPRVERKQKQTRTCGQAQPHRFCISMSHLQGTRLAAASISSIDAMISSKVGTAPKIMETVLA
jgi:hypothetical protein